MLLLSFFPSLVFSVSQITGIKSSPYPSISSGGEYVFFQCVFSGFNQTAIVYDNEQSKDNDILLLYCLFDRIFCESAAFSINCAQINSNFTCNALTNCGNTDKNNGAFYYQTAQLNIDFESPLFEYLTVYNCKCYSKLMNLRSHTDGNNDLHLSESNITSCYSNYNRYGILYLDDHTPHITHCSFAENLAPCIIDIEDAEVSYQYEPQGTITYCNFVRNNVNESGVICSLRLSLLIDYCIMIDNQLPSGDYLVTNVWADSLIYITNSKIQSKKLLDANGAWMVIIDNTNTIIGNNKPTTYAYTFYATHGCHADIPLSTPAKTKIQYTHAYIHPQYHNKIKKQLYMIQVF